MHLVRYFSSKVSKTECIWINGAYLKKFHSKIFDVEVELTANHQGTFQFKLCPVKDSTIEVTQDCLNGFEILFNTNKLG